MKTAVLVINYLFLLVTIYGLIMAVSSEGANNMLDRNAIIGMLIFLALTLFNLIFIHRTSSDH